MNEVYDPHFLRAITELGDRCKVAAVEAIFAHGGIKLVEKGGLIDSRLYDRLVQHRLQVPIDQSLIVEGSLTSADLRRHADALIEEHPLCRRLAASSDLRQVLLATLERVPLPASIAFRLALMREQRPELFLHSLQVALVALFLAAREGVAETRATSLATAALLHDIGVMHIDPTLLQRGHQLTPKERHHLLAHPLTAMIIVQQYAAYSGEVATAILEHHERLDGSGYPRGLRSKEISPFGRILSLSEVVSAMFEHNRDAPGLQLSLILRLNHRMFDQSLINHIVGVLPQEGELQTPSVEHGREIMRLSQMHLTFSTWASMSAPLSESERRGHGAVVFIDDRLAALKQSMIEAGIQPDQLELLGDVIDDDPDSTAEMVFLARETLWQLENIMHEVQGRWAGLEKGATPVDAMVNAWCVWLANWLGMATER